MDDKMLSSLGPISISVYVHFRYSIVDVYCHIEMTFFFIIVISKYFQSSLQHHILDNNACMLHSMAR